MKVGILGGGNCHALALARHLHAEGIDCFGIGRSAPKAAPLWLAPAGYRYHVAHLGRDLVTTLGLLDSERPDVVVNFAAQGEGAASWGVNAWLFYQTNAVVMARLAEELVARKWLQLFVHIGTSELYGSVDHPATETDALQPGSPYAISKAAFDQHLLLMSRSGFPCVVVRPSNCYVEGQQLHRVVPRAAIAAVHGGTLPLSGGGVARKSYLHSDDLARAIWRVAQCYRVGQVFNVGPEQPISIRELVQEVADRAGVDLKDLVEEAPARPFEDGCYWLDSSKVRALGWEPQVELWSGVERMLSWAQQYPELAQMPNRPEVTP